MFAAAPIPESGGGYAIEKPNTAKTIKCFLKQKRQGKKSFKLAVEMTNVNYIFRRKRF